MIAAFMIAFYDCSTKKKSPLSGPYKAAYVPAANYSFNNSL